MKRYILTESVFISRNLFVISDLIPSEAARSMLVR